MAGKVQNDTHLLNIPPYLDMGRGESFLSCRAVSLSYVFCRQICAGFLYKNPARTRKKCQMPIIYTHSVAGWLGDCSSVRKDNILISFSTNSQSPNHPATECVWIVCIWHFLWVLAGFLCKNPVKNCMQETILFNTILDLGGNACIPQVLPIAIKTNTSATSAFRTSV